MHRPISVTKIHPILYFEFCANNQLLMQVLPDSNQKGRFVVRRSHNSNNIQIIQLLQSLNTTEVSFDSVVNDWQWALVQHFSRSVNAKRFLNFPKTKNSHKENSIVFVYLWVNQLHFSRDREFFCYEKNLFCCRQWFCCLLCFVLNWIDRIFWRPLTECSAAHLTEHENRHKKANVANWSFD